MFSYYKKCNEKYLDYSNIRFNICYFYENMVSLKISTFPLGKLVGTLFRLKVFYLDEASQNFSLYVQFMLAFTQTITFQGNLPKKADFVRNYSLHTTFIS